MRLKERVNKLEEELNEKSKIIEFLCNYDKDDVIITQQGGYVYANIFSINTTLKKNIVYLYGGKLHEIDVNYLAYRELTVLKNTKTEALIGIAYHSNKGYKPLILNKATETLTEISDEMCEQLLKNTCKKEGAESKYRLTCNIENVKSNLVDGSVSIGENGNVSCKSNEF